MFHFNNNAVMGIFTNNNNIDVIEKAMNSFMRIKPC